MYIMFNIESVVLKEPQNHIRELFLCPQQKRRKHNKHFKLLFFKLNSHFGLSN